MVDVRYYEYVEGKYVETRFLPQSEKAKAVFEQYGKVNDYYPFACSFAEYMEDVHPQFEGLTYEELVFEEQEVNKDLQADIEML